MAGNIGLFIRMMLYLGGAFVAGQGWATFNPGAGTLTIQIEPLVEVLAGLSVFGGTFAASRVVKKKGGTT
tara:strand:- start:4370 stop:4579 length:210 start_codon:yes stop_codon:yes gene_type:complete